MDETSLNPEQRVLRYLNGKRGIEQRRLGSGTDGEVFIVTGYTAVKVLYDEHRYLNELMAYRRLAEEGIEKIGQFVIPRLLGNHDRMHIIEMTVVRPPYLIDFGKSSVDTGQGWSNSAMAEWWEKIEDRFENDAPIASQIFTQLRRKAGIYHWDLNPQNLNFGPLSKNPSE